MSSESAIEVYEWQPGRARPGTRTKAREDSLTLVEVPPDGQAPVVGDIIHLPNPDWKEAKDVRGLTIRYRVISREVMWEGPPPDDRTKPGRYSKMWLHVRRLTDDEWAAEESEE